MLYGSLLPGIPVGLVTKSKTLMAEVHNAKTESMYFNAILFLDRDGLVSRKELNARVAIR